MSIYETAGTKKLLVHGIVKQGFRIASGMNKEGIPGPYGTILKDSLVRQRPFFEKEVPEMKELWTGTINVNIAPRLCKILKYDHTITCEWHPGITETFGLVKGLTVIAHGKRYPAILYYPLPSEIHIPRDEVIEIIAPKIEGLSYGDKVVVEVSPEKITIIESQK